MLVSGFTFNAFSENTYLLHDATKECVVVDPGCYSRAEQQALQAFIEEHQLRVVLLVNTHAHIDHVLGNAFVLNTYQVPFLLHEADFATLRAVGSYAPSYGFAQYQPAEPTGTLAAGQPLRFGETELEVRFAPGHAPGHVVFYHAPLKVVIGGDVLFQGSIGRTDLPGGDYATLIQSIKTELLTLPDDVTVYAGHGPATTIGAERRSNPFLQ
ncbi:MBL fold metallo-hydrolase [Hymenobacter lutimineralis]|uniref:MBL fold metallo-hydrolase n=1 Tax=Hymenobacter lutimineralis TaxID=2606448 RepID=A0A5D6V269_9BACT|nr:MBL fold metallo-hydrolase [Hymenobacter lutimineralis]TYZ10151.1 MBL fold metallo-hydrolase [Hymenobacter lutimineralis]